MKAKSALSVVGMLLVSLQASAIEKTSMQSESQNVLIHQIHTESPAESSPSLNQADVVASGYCNLGPNKLLPFCN